MEAVGQQSAPAAPLVFTDLAAAKVGELITEEGNSALMLRVFISGGGCSGFQYGFTFDECREDGDTAIENAGVVLLVDPMSVQYLMGAEIDYKEIIKKTSRVPGLSSATPLQLPPVDADLHSRFRVVVRARAIEFGSLATPRLTALT
jgi:iron-sulfur cluster insertion protein